MTGTLLSISLHELILLCDPILDENLNPKSSDHIRREVDADIQRTESKELKFELLYLPVKKIVVAENIGIQRTLIYVETEELLFDGLYFELKLWLVIASPSSFCQSVIGQIV